MACDLIKITVQVADGMVGGKTLNVGFIKPPSLPPSLFQCFLANHGFVHHDISTRNVLVGPHLHVKIGNPGMLHEGYYYVVTDRKKRPPRMSSLLAMSARMDKSSFALSHHASSSQVT